MPPPHPNPGSPATSQTHLHPASPSFFGAPAPAARKGRRVGHATEHFGICCSMTPSFTPKLASKAPHDAVPFEIHAKVTTIAEVKDHLHAERNL